MGRACCFRGTPYICVRCDCYAGTMYSHWLGTRTSPLLLRALPVVCFCKGGFRSSIAVSLLLKEGFSAQDVQLGFAAISTYSPELTTTGEVSTE